MATAEWPTPAQPAPSSEGLHGVVPASAMNTMFDVARTLIYIASHDGLTGALNKEAIKSQTGEFVEKRIPFGLFMMDWDAFKQINDVFGHEKADEMLGAFVPYFQSGLRREGEAVAHERYFQNPEDNITLGRYGGDEFVGLVNLSDRGRPDGLTPQKRMVKYEKYVRDLTTNFAEEQDPEIRNLRFGISVGKGIWIPPAGGRVIVPKVVSNVFRQADSELRRDKIARKAPARN